MKLANTATRPVELHLPSGVVVVGPQESIQCTAEDLMVGQVVELCRRGVLVAHSAPPDNAKRSAPDKAASAKSPAQPRRRTGTRSRRTP